MKTLIAIPCMDMLPAVFLRSLLQLQIIGEVSYDIVTSSLIYDARNLILAHALEGDCDYILWLDSDMTIEPDALWKLKIALESGYDIACGLCFKRVEPYAPTIYRRCELVQLEGGKIDPVAEPFLDYPREQIFDIAACGFGCVLMSTAFARRVTELFGPYPFMPVGGFGEDLSFCIRALRAGGRICCDSSVRAGHCGRMIFDESWWLARRDPDAGNLN